MNKQEYDVLNVLITGPYINQRILAEDSGHSLGTVNKAIKTLIEEGYLDEAIHPTERAMQEYEEKAPKKAIILAAGFGMRMVPINMEMPKGLLEVNGEPLIERLIKQLHEVGVWDIYVVVGFLKERYEYLIDEFGVELIVNTDYAVKNNIHSLYKAVSHLYNCYVVPCDIWCDRNPFHQHELYSWYMVSDLISEDSDVRINRKGELVRIPRSSSGNEMIGIAYLVGKQAEFVKKKIKKFCEDEKYDDAFWEIALYDADKMIVQAKSVRSVDVVEINTYEQLRDLDSDSDQLKSDAIDVISESLKVREDEITEISVLKKGMTNRSFLFRCAGKRYIMRIPGEGTDQLIDRGEEAEVYQTIREKHICDEIVYINPQNGYKITGFFEKSRVCDPYSEDDLKKCMKKLREFHQLKLKVDHEFDIYQKIDFYESLCEGKSSVYKDYFFTKDKIMSLKEYINRYTAEKVLTHIDAVPDNFLFVENEEGNEEVRLIDWEYAGMQDPHVDIAMFCIYSLYDKAQVDRLIDIYFEDRCSKEIRIKIYCYIASCGLLWSNWCEYKSNLGVEFGEYSLRQYRYAKEYYKIVSEELLKA